MDLSIIIINYKTKKITAACLETIKKSQDNLTKEVIVIDNGQITEQGTHDELLSNDNSLYKKLWELQAGGFLVD